MQQFRTIEEMERFYYGDLNSDMIKKASTLDQILSSDTAYWVKLVGAKIWSQINFERNAAAAIPKEPWVKTNFRLETATGHTFPSGGIAEGSATAGAAISGTLHPTLANISAPPKLVDHGWGMTWKQYLLGSVDDTVTGAQVAEDCGKAHARAISAYMVEDVDAGSGNGFESLDRIASSSAEGGHCSTASDPDLWSINRSAATTYDAQVSSSGSAASHLRDLTVSLIDGVWASVTKAGGYPKVILTGYNTIKAWSALLEAERRFNVLGEAKFIPRSGEAAGVTPGYEAGFNVATYNGVPIIPCQDYDSSRATVRTNEVAPILFIDTEFVRVGMLMPTKYVQSTYPGDTINLNQHRIEGHFFTSGEPRCYNFVAQGKLTDIK